MTFSEISPNYIKESVNLLETAFPQIERRPTEKWKALITDEPAFHALAILERGVFCGLLSYWDLGSFLYIEHFAICENKRNGGYGKKALEAFLYEHQHMNIVLEVELPENDLAQRRIKFYERNGFNLIEEKDYLQPPYDPTYDYIPLKLMATQGKTCRTYYDEIVEKIHQKAYGVKK